MAKFVKLQVGDQQIVAEVHGNVDLDGQFVLFKINADALVGDDGDIVFSTEFFVVTRREIDGAEATINTNLTRSIGNFEFEDISHGISTRATVVGTSEDIEVLGVIT